MDKAVVGMREGGRRIVDIPAEMNMNEDPAVPSLTPAKNLKVIISLKSVKT